ncbi:MAG TPA: 1-acyl-sn-glycerol-3-phosphate acyltransferase, partial [Clostridia bacterium]|nr:1-acyl-sn-glycerol-3-phosphate acyltransferase [Clostridia bacterium]
YRFKVAKNLPETYIVLSNHNTDYDMLLVGLSFPRQMYFVASEHILRWKRAAKFLRYAFQPIARYKGSTASSTVMEVLRCIRTGSNVCIFAEGNRSWDGVTNPILASTGKMVKSARCGLVTFRFEGGYFVSPNWSEKNTRRGRFYGAPVNVYSKELLAAMSVEEINAAIARDLHEDAYERQLKNPARYRGKNLAEKMEHLMFLCPQCGAEDSLRSCGNTVTCDKCGLSFRYTEYGMLEGLPYTTVKELAAWQKAEVKKVAAQGSARFTATEATLTGIARHEATPVDSGALEMDCAHLVCGKTAIPLSSISDMAMHGRRDIVFTTPDNYYELSIGGASNTLKFLMLYEAFRQGEMAEV